MHVTEAQRRACRYIFHQVEEWRFHSDDYEYKGAVVEEAGFGGNLWVRLEVGRKNDEGTLASLLCRTRYHLMVGPRGGISSPSWKGKPRRGRHCWRPVGRKPVALAYER